MALGTSPLKDEDLTTFTVWKRTGKPEPHRNHILKPQEVLFIVVILGSMRKIHKSCHPRENQMFKEVDDEYRGKWHRLKRELEARERG
jgi:hypothetical protein